MNKKSSHEPLKNIIGIINELINSSKDSVLRVGTFNTNDSIQSINVQDLSEAVFIIALDNGTEGFAQFIIDNNKTTMYALEEKDLKKKLNISYTSEKKIVIKALVDEELPFVYVIKGNI